MTTILGAKEGEGNTAKNGNRERLTEERNGYLDMSEGGSEGVSERERERERRPIGCPE